MSFRRPTRTTLCPRATQLSHYRIEKPISGGGFSIVYLATDEKTGEPVAIKEYLPSTQAQRGDEAARWNRVTEETAATFRQRHQVLLRGRPRRWRAIYHPNIVRVVNFFRANDTVYMVMRYESRPDAAASTIRNRSKDRRTC
ncbi:MAG: hypothetical protein MZV65_13270 [Chromatiales bacterium]|nr:hypothetical protein [Chromatiales bacterium]